MKLNWLTKLKKNCEIQAVFEKGHSINGRYLVVYFLRNSLNNNRFGFCVGKKLGTAVCRNRVKRLLREAVRTFSNFNQEGWDILLVARSLVKNASLEIIIGEIERILVKANILTLCK